MRLGHIIIATAVVAVPTLANAKDPAPTAGRSTISGRMVTSGFLQPPATEANYTFPSFSTLVNNPADPNDDFDPTNVSIGAVPAGNYTQFTATVEWSSVSGNAWSNETFMVVSPTPANNALDGIWYAAGFATNGAGNTSPRVLNFSGPLQFPYGGGSPNNFWGFQTFDGTAGQWNNVSITYLQGVLPMPPAATGVFPTGAISTTLAAGEIKWYRFDWNGVDTLPITTVGSVGPTGTLDTELALFSATGALVLQNDDVSGGDLSSLITLDSSFMPAGTYWLAASGSNSTYPAAPFAVTSTSTEAGTLRINGVFIPEPATLAVIGGTALLALRRSRRV